MLLGFGTECSSLKAVCDNGVLCILVYLSKNVLGKPYTYYMSVHMLILKCC